MGTSSGPGVTSGDASGGNTGNGNSGNGNSTFSGPGAISGVNNTVVATPSVAGAVSVAAGASRNVSVTFNSDDGRTITGFAISGTTLPGDWSGPDSFSCASVSTGNGCVLNLSYAPPAVGSGTLTLNYIYVDNANMPKAPGGSVTIAYAATAQNNVVATASPTGQVNTVAGKDSRTVSINFTTDDGNAATDLNVTNLGALPAGWSSTAAGLACAIVSTGSGCQLALNYAPTAAASGTLTLNYGYTDDSGMARTGALNIPYSTTADDNVVAAAAPNGQITAVANAGAQSVAVTFTTDDGKPAAGLYVISALAALPPGWSSAAKDFSCSGVSTGNGCQLHLNYAPTTLTRGTLALNYGYTSNAGTAKSGLLNVEYTATTNDNVVGTASPTGQINAVVGMGTQSVAVAFTTDDGRPATALELTSSLAALPAGWSSTDAAFACSGLSSGNGCLLTLRYAPLAAASGTLTLNYAYKNNAGESKTGSVNIAYRATTDDSIVGTPSQNPLSVVINSSTTVTVAFTTDDGNPASGLSVTSGLSPLPSGWSTTSGSFACASVSSGAGCTLSLTYAPTTVAGGTLSLTFDYDNNSGIAKTGSVSIPYTATP
jgi:hypothetical protein